LGEVGWGSSEEAPDVFFLWRFLVPIFLKEDAFLPEIQNRAEAPSIGDALAALAPLQGARRRPPREGGASQT